MGIIVDEKIVDFLLFAIFVVITLYFLISVKKDKIPQLIRIAGLDAIDEAIGRSVEMGKNVFFTPFQSMLTDDRAPQTIAALSTLGYISREASLKGCRLITSYNFAEAGPLLDSIITEGFQLGGHPELYNRESDLVFQPYRSCTLGSIDLFEKENIGSAIMIGYAFYSILLYTEVLRKINAYQVAGTAAVNMLSFMVGSCDYTLLGEEIYAAGAYLSKDESMTKTIGAQDYNKLILLLSYLITIVLYNLGWKGILTLLNL